VVRCAFGTGARARGRIHQERVSKNRRGRNGRAAGRGRALAHDPEKWAPVFGSDHAQTEKLNPGQGMGDINLTGVTKAYDRWAPVYDLVFGKVFDEGRRSTIAEADRIGGRGLDGGVGTRLSLSGYARSTQPCGVGTFPRPPPPAR